MKKEIFQCDGPSGTIEFEIDGETFCIRESGKCECLIPSNTLRLIKYGNHPWISQNKDMSFRLSLIWTNNGKEQRKDILLFHDRKANLDLLRLLQTRYPDQCLIGPSEQERKSFLAGFGKSIYRLYTLGLATTLGIISAILIIEIIFLYLSLSTSQFVSISNTDTFYRAGKILFIAAVIPLCLFIMIIKKTLMVVKADHRGLTVQKVFVRKALIWDELEPRCVRSDTSNVYTGLFCYNSDQANVLTASNFVEVSLSIRAGKATVLKMPADEAGRLYREFYYRGKVSLEEAKGVKAFL